MDKHQNAALQGWTSSPNGRGTIDILSSSCLTLLLCSWTVLCLNVFPASFGRWRQGWRKTLMACFTWLGPEFTFQIAIGQWCSACRSVEKFRQSGYHGWSMTHAFLADMGGFVLKPRISSTEKWSTFPLDAEQVHYLVVHKYVPYSAVNIEKEIIEDKNKVDVPLRLITVCQILWYFVGTIARASQGLTITVLELATMGFIVCTVGTYFFWFHKPMDIGRPFVLEPTATIQEILLEAGDRAQQPYKRTPLDFAGREEWWSWTLCWAYCFGIMRKLGIRLTTLERPITKIPDDFYPQLSHTASCILFVLQTGFAAVHLSGWSFQFPTHMERLLWHIATINIMIVILTFWVIHLFWWVLPLALRAQWGNISVGKGTTNDPPIEMPKDPVSIEDSENLPRSYLSRIVLVFRHAAARLRNNSYPHDPAQDVPLTALIPVLICCAIYMVSRAYIIIEGFINLRALPPGAYDSVDWTAFLPHF